MIIYINICFVSDTILNGSSEERGNLTGEVISNVSVGLAATEGLSALGSETELFSKVKVPETVVEGVSEASLGVDELVVADNSFLNASGKIDWEKSAPNRGYVLGTEVEDFTIDVGKMIDRYGNPRGSFTSPAGVPYGQRALPYIENPNAYHQYEVLKPIGNVKMGEIAPAFNQTGGGVQYELPNSVEFYKKNGYLKEIK